MNKRRCPPVPATITTFSPERIVLKSTSDASIFVLVPSILGIYFIVLGILEGLIQHSYFPLPTFLLLSIGAVLVFLSFALHRTSWQIEFDSYSETISGLPNIVKPLSFSKIVRIHLEPEGYVNLWRVTLETANKSHITVTGDYPLDLALVLGKHLSYMLARPLIESKSTTKTKLPKKKWQLPYKMSSGHYSAQWTVFSAAIAILTAFFLDFLPGDLFDYLLWPRWVIILMTMIPCAVLIMNIQEQFDLSIMAKSSLLIIALMIGCAAISLTCPAVVSLLLIPCLFFGILSVNAFVIGNKNLVFPIITLICFTIVIPFSVRAISLHHSFRTVDPGIISEIEFYSLVNDDDQFHKIGQLNKPSDIRDIITGMQQSNFFKNDQKSKSNLLKVRLIRPFGKNINFVIYRYGLGSNAEIIIELWSRFLGRPVRFDVLSSRSMSQSLDDLSLRHEFLGVL